MKLSEELGQHVHYIADGHHRVAASLVTWDKAGRPQDAGVMCVMYPLDGLSLTAFHRRVSGPVHVAELLALLEEGFEVRDVAALEEAVGCFGVYVDHRWFDLTYTGERLPGAAGLDVAILDDHVLTPLLGTHPHASPRLEITSALGGVRRAGASLRPGRRGAVHPAPPSLDQLTEVADRGEVSHRRRPTSSRSRTPGSSCADGRRLTKGRIPCVAVAGCRSRRRTGRSRPVATRCRGGGVVDLLSAAAELRGRPRDRLRRWR